MRKPHPPHIQTLLDLAANTPLQVHFAIEDPAAVEQMIQSFQAIADHCAEHYIEWKSLPILVSFLCYYKSNQANATRLSYFDSPEGKVDPRTTLYKALFSLYRTHHARRKELLAGA